MSLAACNRTFSRKLVEIKDKAKLNIPSEVIKKIDYLHSKVGSDEWSCILIYKIASGIIENPKDLVLQVVDIIPMDIGNATYTEYDYNTEDTYAFDKFTGALENGYKLGHLHSHHNMACFFSGTDTAELHDNAPNHNFYVSLIVNFKDPSNWCAAIATCVDEIKEGSIKRQGTITTKKKYKGTNGFQETVTAVNIDEDVPIKEESGILYKIDLEIIAEALPEDEEFVQRISELKAKKASVYNRNNYNFAGLGFGENWREHHIFPHNFKSSSHGGAAQGNLFQGQEKKEEIEEDEIAKAEAQMMNLGNKTPKRFKGCYSAAKVRPFLIYLLGENDGNIISVGAAVSRFISATSHNPSYLQYQLGDIEEKFQMKCDNFFNMEGEELDYCAIAHSCMDILTPYKNLDVHKLLMDVFDVYVLDDDSVDYNLISIYTGLEFEDVVQNDEGKDKLSSQLKAAEEILKSFDNGTIKKFEAKKELVKLGAKPLLAEDLLDDMFITSEPVQDFILKLPRLFAQDGIVTNNREFNDFHE